VVCFQKHPQSGNEANTCTSILQQAVRKVCAHMLTITGGTKSERNLSGNTIKMLETGVYCRSIQWTAATFLFSMLANSPKSVWSNCPTTGTRAACSLPQRFQWPAEAFKKSPQIWNLLKSVWGYICLTEFLPWTRCICTRTMPFLYAILFYLFTLNLG